MLRNVSILEHTLKTGAKKYIRKGGAAGGYNKGCTEGLAFHLQMAERLLKDFTQRSGVWLGFDFSTDALTTVCKISWRQEEQCGEQTSWRPR